MLIFVDKRAPAAARQHLLKYGDMLEFSTTGIVYEAISGHPDIFLCQTPEMLVVAPNMPDKYFSILKSRSIVFTIGKNPVGAKYPETAGFNAVVTEKFLVHQPGITDPEILKAADKKPIVSVKQAYTRCNLLFLNKKAAITSDRGIENQLINHHLNVLYVDPKPVILPGFQHGFFGGTCGMFHNHLVVLGSLKFHHQGNQIRKFVNEAGVDIAELYDGPLYDGGAVLFLT